MLENLKRDASNCSTKRYEPKPSSACSPQQRYATHWTAMNSGSTINPSSTSPLVRWSAQRRCCGGITRSAVRSAPRSHTDRREPGLIVPIGSWVIEQACQRLSHWQRTDLSMSVAVNLSVRQVLTPDILKQIEGVLKSTRAMIRTAST